jgi:PAS domain S-box-containing protein
MLGLMLTLPWATALRVLTNISLPVLVIYPPGTALLGVLMVNRLRRERVKERLRESEEIFRSFMEYSPIYVFFKDENIRAIHLSKNYEKMLGKPVAELLGKNMDDLFPSELAKCMVADDMRILKEGKRVNVEEEFNGRFYSTIKFPIFIDGKQPYLAGYTIDISDRKHAEELYRTVVESSLAAVFIVQDGKLRYTNDTTIIYSGYSSEELIGQRSEILVHPEDREMLRIKIREMLLRKDVSPCEFRVVTKDGRIKWILQIFSPIMHEGKPAILGNAIDITERKQAGEQLKQSLEQLRRAVETTIQVLALAVETRDPYTAGHQQRTTNLARAIATEMGLPTEKIEGIRMAGHIHDIGKISVPAEILSKPTKLTEIELSLIQEHAQHGYDILKDVVSAWPLAEMVYQHHERMDGSGYPRRLKGEEILIEARILAVADVVESMASNRPYRPSLGIDAALEEIEKNSGTLYDNTVADACLRIFREKRFRLEGI